MSKRKASRRSAEGEQDHKSSRGFASTARRQWDPAAVAAFTILVLVVAGCIVVPMLFTSTWTGVDLGRRALAPGQASELGTHILGTDPLGRDIFVRVFQAGRTSLVITSLSLAAAVAFGTMLGLLAAYSRGWIEAVIMRLVDATMSFPTLLLAVVIVFIIGPSVPAVIFVLAASRWPVFARIARSEGLRVAQLEFMAAYRCAGYPWRRMILDGYLPNIAAPVVTVGVLNFGQFLLGASSLSFLGLGVQPPAASWGLMVSTGLEYIQTAWWIVTVPGLLIFLVSLAASVLADEVGRRVDPIAGGAADLGH